MATERTVRLTTAQAIVRFLQAQYSERDGTRMRLIPAMFGIFGHGNVAGLGQALEEYGDSLPYYQPKNEQAMVHVATGYAKATKRMSTMACTSSIGPGATNMVTGAATATINRLPVLLFPSDYYATRRQGPVLQQIEHPVSADVSVNDAFRPVSRMFDRITRPEQILTALPEAMRVLVSPVETGAVTISLPQDVQMMAYDYPSAFFSERTWRIPRALPEKQSIEAAARMLGRSEKPMVIAGGGVHYSDATGELAEFCNQLGIPVGETHSGKGAGVGAGLSLGGAGVAGTPLAARIAKDADLVIGVGTRFADFVTGSQALFQNPDVKFVTINVTDHDAHKQGALCIVADAKVGLEALRAAAAGYTAPAEWQDAVRQAQIQWNYSVENEVFAVAGAEQMTQAQMIGIINSSVRPNSMVLAAAGSVPGDLLQLWDCSGDRHCLLEFGYSCMGWEIPGAIGAKMAFPDRDVYAMIGDGTYLMNNTEIVTAVQEGLKVVIVVSVNYGFQVIRRLQMASAGISFGNEFRKREGVGGPLAGEYLEIDYAKNAESMGAVGLHADSPDSLKSALEQADSVRGGPVVIAVDVQPHTFGPDSTVWWDISVAEVSNREETAELLPEYESGREKQRFYSQ